MLVARQPLAFRYSRGGRAIALRAELDFALITPQGRVAYVDAKSCSGKSYPRSALTPHQVRRAYVYNQYNVPSGFIVEFRQHDAVVFFCGLRAHALRAGQSLQPADGLHLGHSLRFSLRPVFEADLGARWASG